MRPRSTWVMSTSAPRSRPPRSAVTTRTQWVPQRSHARSAQCPTMTSPSACTLCQTFNDVPPCPWAIRFSASSVQHLARRVSRATSGAHPAESPARDISPQPDQISSFAAFSVETHRMRAVSWRSNSPKLESPGLLTDLRSVLTHATRRVSPPFRAILHFRVG